MLNYMLDVSNKSQRYIFQSEAKQEWTLSLIILTDFPRWSVMLDWLNLKYCKSKLKIHIPQKIDTHNIKWLKILAI